MGEWRSYMKCPKCGSTNVASVSYGYPTPHALELADQGKLILGGCTPMTFPDPDYGCNECRFMWASKHDDKPSVAATEKS